MHRRVVCVWFLGSALCALGLTGCNGGTLNTHRVEGVVTLDGQPVAGATVMFVPVEGSEGMSASGMTDQNGSYRLTAMGTGEATATAEAGTLPGEYHVGVVKTIVETPLSQEEAMEQGVPYQPPPSNVEPKVEHVVPRKYNLPKQSGLTATVREGTNNIPIELTSN